MYTYNGFTLDNILFLLLVIFIVRLFFSLIKKFKHHIYISKLKRNKKKKHLMKYKHSSNNSYNDYIESCWDEMKNK